MTSNAENHSHHSPREICCGFEPRARTRNLPEPARGECFGLLRDIPKKDFIWLTADLGCHHCSRAQRTEATAKTYRLARFKNLSIRAGAVNNKAFPFLFFRRRSTLRRFERGGRMLFLPASLRRLGRPAQHEIYLSFPGRETVRATTAPSHSASWPQEILRRAAARVRAPGVHRARRS